MRTEIKTINKLRFKDKRDIQFAEYQINLFVKNFISGDNIKYVEIDKNGIRIFNSINGGFRNYDTVTTISTAKEMIIYISTMNSMYNKKEMIRLQMLEISYIAPTSTKNSRVKIYDTRFNQTKIIPFNYEFDNEIDMVKNVLNCNSVAKSWNEKNGKYYLLIDDFKPLKEMIKG